MERRRCGNCVSWKPITLEMEKGVCRNPKGCPGRIKHLNDECCGWHEYKVEEVDYYKENY